MRKLISSLKGSTLSYTIKKGFARIGYSVIPTGQVVSENWGGIKNLPIRTVLDIGALRGEFASEKLRPNFPQAVIHSFEPSPVSFPLLKKLADDSNGAIIAHNYGLGSEEAILSFNINSDFLASSSFLEQTDSNIEYFPQLAKVEHVTARVARLDDIINNLDIKDDLLIKIDTQGFDYQVLLGGIETIKRAKALIIEIQIEQLYQHAADFDQIYNLLRKCGLKFAGTFDQVCGEDGTILFIDGLFVRP